MQTTHAQTEAALVRWPATVVRWAARGLSVFSIGILLLFIFGEGPPTGLTTQEAIGFSFFPLGVMAGMLVGWRWEGAGAAISVGSLVTFYGLNDIWWGGPPGGPYILLFTLPGFLFGLSWLLHRQSGREGGT